MPEAFNWYVRGLQRYIQFTGRAGRAEFWYYILIYILIVIGLRVIDTVLFGVTTGNGVLTWLFWLFSIMPNLAIGARRLHDTGRSGWWLLLSLIPIVGLIVLLIWFINRGQPDSNAYGPPPATTPAG
ncbi:MAG TPA: DUF805 domain-containing protein [Burkholderiaceae bacterium]|nr:DUF805 domain-containing protein [Burkholderiaceae bacterium]